MADPLDQRAVVESVAVVVPAHDAADTIVEQLDALRAADHRSLTEVIVVDSCSTDDTAAVVGRYVDRWDKVRLVRAGAPGANVARNAGISECTTDGVLLCDADDAVTSNWIEIMLSRLQHADLVRGRYSLDELNDEATIAARGSVASTREPPSGEPISGVGGNAAIRRSAWEELGGLREHHYGADDAEFFWRAHLAGMTVVYEPEAVVRYRLRPELRALFKQQAAWASSRALLYQEFGSEGFIARRSTSRALRQWGWLLVHVADARSSDPATVGRWTRVAADCWGRVRGSCRHRVFFP